MNRTSQDMKNLFDALVYEERLKVVKAETEIHIEGKDKCLAAVRTLESLGYTYSEGSSMGGVWEPPKGSLPENEAVYPPSPADRFIVRAFYERTEIPGVFHPGYPESATTFVMNVMARAVQLQASEGVSTDE